MFSLLTLGRRARASEIKDDEARDTENGGSGSNSPCSSREASPEGRSSHKNHKHHHGHHGGRHHRKWGRRLRRPFRINKVRFTSDYFRLFRNGAEPFDWLLLAVGGLASIASGVPLPLIGVLFGDLIDSFNDVSCGNSGAAVALPPDERAAFLASVIYKVKLVSSH